jgi:hypothetical protein
MDNLAGEKKAETTSKGSQRCDCQDKVSRTEAPAIAEDDLHLPIEILRGYLASWLPQTIAELDEFCQDSDCSSISRLL